MLDKLCQHECQLLAVRLRQTIKRTQIQNMALTHLTGGVAETLGKPVYIMTEVRTVSLADEAFLLGNLHERKVKQIK